MNWLELTDEERREQCGRWVAAGGRPERFMKGALTTNADATAAAQAMGASLIDPGDPAFPARVRERVTIVGPWFVRGALPPPALRLAVVGTRAVSHEGARLCSSIVREVAAAGVHIVSGGAIGVDTLAHRAALAVGGTTLAVLPSAFDRPTPPSNVDLFAQIERDGGALVSEYPPGVTAHRFHFHRRNELIAAYSDAVLVVRSKLHGGTMITARAAQRLETAVLAVPGSPEDATAAGCNSLLRQGARCVTNGADVLEELGVDPSTARRRRAETASVSAKAQVLLQLLTQNPANTNELCGASGLRAHEVMVALTELELLDRVEMRDGLWKIC